MEFLASLFVGKPQNILAVAAVFFLIYVTLRVSWPGAGGGHRSLLIASFAWGLYAIWELLVLAITPEANIRADLLVLWPVLGVISAWAVYKILDK
ncbi:hypothetical protein [Microbulbifer sp. Q7]|uniref:hypothetical protein n=1 Tax=Microbulbifer sp. Q7 TaxID=1785091 RepID=UPI00082A729E|nr:hypothetical protein [Microbulbifer sp. Q7]